MRPSPRSTPTLVSSPTPMTAWCCTRIARCLSTVKSCSRRGWRSMGLSLNEAKSHIGHTLEGDQPGFAFLGFDIRQYRVGKHQSGKGPRGHRRLGYKTLIKPAKANVKDHLAELGRIIKRGKALPQGPLIRQLNPKIRGWATYYRIGVSQAAYAAARSPHLGEAPPLGTLATSEEIDRLGHPAVLASGRRPSHLCHLGHRPRCRCTCGPTARCRLPGM